MKVLGAILIAISLSMIAVKLFTYEFFLRDDPTCGIALRGDPALTSHAPLRILPSGRTDRVLIQDENDYLGGSAYRFVVGVGWILFPALSIIILILSSVRGRETER